MKRSLNTWPLLLGLFGLFAVNTAQAAGWVAVLKNTPAEVFDDEDLQMFLAAAGKVLNAESPAEPLSWSNPATGAAGRFKELGHSQSKDGQPCKRMQFWVSAKARSETSAIWTACKTTQGRWVLTAAR
jgi:hypothetical protein